ncbi:hypothetical protein [Pelagicoccus sp. SDUM812002]|uniref:hypothetical protein n=1 Tax=Pelagicoccus sp. SDUM812002 TaxID=3041266 RepID=UPI00280D65D4|nr:hypothetical protein [Pelagicoccus sp. SDUM812002]MDQ8184055.1 hypothetical protein [Pelagicoccus sp. SDUM812002]
MMTPIYKFLINWYQASDKDLPAWLERACRSDKALSKEKAFGDVLTRELQRRPSHSGSFSGDSMAARVLRQIAEEDYAAEQENSRSPLWGAWIRNAGMAVAALAVVLAGYQYLNTDDEMDGEAGVVAVVEDNSASDGILEIAEDWKNPLDQEIEYIVSDAKGALGFLANSFVPSSYLQEEDKA